MNVYETNPTPNSKITITCYHSGAWHTEYVVTHVTASTFPEFIGHKERQEPTHIGNKSLEHLQRGKKRW